jgi:predicted O-methyltransferase YrrM
MNQDRWTAVDRYLADQLALSDAALEAALAASDAAGLPAINVTPHQGKLLHLLARAIQAKNILEIGTLGGYSTIWLARALPPGGRLITLESEPKHAEVARQNIDRAGLTPLVDLRLGQAIETLPQIAAENRGPFDLVFIDADKPSTPDYFTWSLSLARPGSLIIVDNVIRKGAVAPEPHVAKPLHMDEPLRGSIPANPVVKPSRGRGSPSRESGVGETAPHEAGPHASQEAANIAGIRRFLALAAAEPRVSLTALQTVGSKGYDGFALALVL